jgi:hypothetical protein
MELKTTLEQLYPEGTKGGQCVYFLHKMVDFPNTGNYLKQKIATVNTYGIPVSKLNNDFRVGDIVITNESRVYGHGALVNSMSGSYLQLTEANYHLDEKVHHTRRLSRNSKSIIGVIRGRLKIKVTTMQLVNDKGTIYLLTGNKDRRKIGIADLESLGLFGDEPQEAMDTKGIPIYNTISNGKTINSN